MEFYQSFQNTVLRGKTSMRNIHLTGSEMKSI